MECRLCLQIIWCIANRQAKLALLGYDKH